MARKYQNKNVVLYNDKMENALHSLPANSIDAVITDPPYEIGFMNSKWDKTGIAFRPETWKKVYRVLKPGGYVLAFNHPRTFHRMTVAIEDAGFVIRDVIMWLYGEGFPKSKDISKEIDRHYEAERDVVGYNNRPKGWFTNKDGHEITTAKTDEAKKWQGWGTALKPAYEPIVVARKPFISSAYKNVLNYGTGALNIDACRVEGDTPKAGTMPRLSDTGEKRTWTTLNAERLAYISNSDGRWPANVIHDGQKETIRAMGEAYRYFYTAKTSKKDRDEGLYLLKEKSTGELQGGRKEGSAGSKMPSDGRLNPYARAGAVRKNNHPTVKPTDLMQYLIRLITPKGGKILDPFMGSGSTGKAAMIENNIRGSNYTFIGIDKDDYYCKIAQARIEYGMKYTENKGAESAADNQLSIFDILEGKS